MRTDRLLKLAEFLDTLPEEKFNIRAYVKKAENGCGTVCCAVGWLPQVDPDNWKWKTLPLSQKVLPELRCNNTPPGTYNSTPTCAEDAMVYFDICPMLFDDLFMSGGYTHDDVTPTDVANAIRNVVKEHIHGNN